MTTFESCRGATKGIGCDDVTFDDLYRTKNVSTPISAVVDVKPAFESKDFSIEPAFESKDFSIHGLCFKAIKVAAANMAKTLFVDKKEEIKESHLGRWKVGVDNFKKGRSYSYDHTA